MNFERHCRIPLLQTALAHDEPTPLNSLKARAIEGVYLGPTNNVQGGHWVYNLETKAKITCQYITEVPEGLTPLPTAMAWRTFGLPPRLENFSTTLL